MGALALLDPNTVCKCTDLGFDPNTITWAGAFAVLGVGILILAGFLVAMYFVYSMFH